MDIHEYQAKELLAGFGVAIPRGGVAYSPEQAVYRASEIGGSRWAVKAQIHSGARGKAGGIKLCSSEDEVRQAAKALLVPAVGGGVDAAQWGAQWTQTVNQGGQNRIVGRSDRLRTRARSRTVPASVPDPVARVQTIRRTVRHPNGQQ